MSEGNKEAVGAKRGTFGGFIWSEQAAKTSGPEGERYLYLRRARGREGEVFFKSGEGALNEGAGVVQEVTTNFFWGSSGGMRVREVAQRRE